MTVDSPTLRGRPPHDDVLTPAEWRVLAYVQLGRTNAQIAEHLGITVNTVRYHVANLLAKSGCGSRRELGEWRPVGLTGARRRAPFFRGDRFAALREVLAGRALGAFGLTAADIAAAAAPAGEDPALFTGTVEEVGEVLDVADFRVAAPVVAADTRAGDWLAVNGVALRVQTVTDGVLSLETPADRVRRTNIAALRPGAPVNLERAARVSDRMTGHIVAGRVDGTATLRELTPEGDAVVARYEAGRELLRYVVEQGRIAVDGVSLTVTEKTPAGFRVSLIPLTRARTNLTARRLGEQVNVETDLLARCVEQLIAEAEGSRT